MLSGTAAALNLAALQPFVPISEDAKLSKSELRDILKQDKITIQPAGTRSSFVDRLEYNLTKLDVSGYGDYDAGVFWEQTKAIKWDVLALYGGVTAFGFKNWDWGSSGYHFQSEGWFGTDTKYGGMDKLGHAYTGYLLTDYFSQRIAHEVSDPNNAIITGAILGMGFQTYVEFFDGFAGEHGFSYEDFIADGVGVGFSVLRNTIPELADKLDFRLEYYKASKYHDWAPATDYAGQKYVLALKLAGFEEFENTPLRFVELQGGYFTQGYTDAERDRGVDKKRVPYVAVGFNLNELLGEVPDAKETLPGLAASRVLEYYQVPYTYVPSATR